MTEQALPGYLMPDRFIHFASLCFHLGTGLLPDPPSLRPRCETFDRIVVVLSFALGVRWEFGIPFIAEFRAPDVVECASEEGISGRINGPSIREIPNVGGNHSHHGSTPMSFAGWEIIKAAMLQPPK